MHSFSYRCGGHKFGVGLATTKAGLLCFLEALELLEFPTFRAAFHASLDLWPLPPSSKPAMWHLTSTVVGHISFIRTLVGPTQVIQDNLHFKMFDLMATAKSLLPYKLTVTVFSS